MSDPDDLMQQEGYDLMAAAFEVYNENGFGLAEDIYQESLEEELSIRGIPFAAKEELAVFYKRRRLKKKFIPDLFVYGGIIVELKAAQRLVPEHEAQLINYLKITGKKVGYVINFGSPGKLEWKRIVLTSDRLIRSRPAQSD